MFSTLIMNRLNDHAFLNQALLALDTHIAEQSFSFNAETVLAIMADDMLCCDDVEVGEVKVDSSYRRLHLASRHLEFSKQLLCSRQWPLAPNVFPVPLIRAQADEIHEIDTVSCFLLPVMVKRLKKELHIKLTEAKTILAILFGLKSGNELEHFMSRLGRLNQVWIDAFKAAGISRDLCAKLLNCSKGRLHLISPINPFRSGYNLVRNGFGDRAFREVFDATVESIASNHLSPMMQVSIESDLELAQMISAYRTILSLTYPGKVCSGVGDLESQVNRLIVTSILYEVLAHSRIGPLVWSERGIKRTSTSEMIARAAPFVWGERELERFRAREVLTDDQILDKLQRESLLYVHTSSLGDFNTDAERACFEEVLQAAKNEASDLQIA